MQPDKADFRDNLIQGREWTSWPSERERGPGNRGWLALRTTDRVFCCLVWEAVLETKQENATKKRVKGLLRGRPRRKDGQGAVVTMMMKECVLVDDDMDLWGPVSRLGRQQNKAITSGHVNNI